MAKPRLTFIDNLILGGKVLSRGSLLSARGSYKRSRALRLTWEFKEAQTDEQIRLAYQYGKHGSWRAMVEEQING